MKISIELTSVGHAHARPNDVWISKGDNGVWQQFARGNIQQHSPKRTPFVLQVCGALSGEHNYDSVMYHICLVQFDMQ